MTLDTCASSYRVPVEFPGEVGRERYRLWRELKCLQDDLHDLGSGPILTGTWYGFISHAHINHMHLCTKYWLGMPIPLWFGPYTT